MALPMHYCCVSMNAKIALFRRPDDQCWSWRLHGPGGNIIAADGGRGYESKSAAAAMAMSIIGGMYAHADLFETAG